MLLNGLAEGLVHDGDRADPAYRLLERGLRVGGVHAPGLEPEQGGHRLQVVLHPVVDLADRRVLGDQLTVTATQLRDVAQQDQRTDVLTLRAQRDAARDHGDSVTGDLRVLVEMATEH